jgi:hypothetical protein
MMFGETGQYAQLPRGLSSATGTKHSQQAVASSPALHVPLLHVPSPLHNVPSLTNGCSHTPSAGLQTAAMVQAPAGWEQLTALTHEHTPADARHSFVMRWLLVAASQQCHTSFAGSVNISGSAADFK